MSPNGKTNGSPQAREKSLRSKKLYWVAGTLVVALVLFTLYYSVYVSSRQSYYSDRAFRLLSSMGDKFARDVEIAENVLKASASWAKPEEAKDYVREILHGRLEESDFAIIGWNKKNPEARPSRNGLLTLYMPDSPHTFRIRADYREWGSLESEQPSGRLTPPKAQSQASDEPCSGELPDLTVCATIDFAPLVRPAFRDLEEGFFDDVLFVDSQGNVLYQQSPGGFRIQNLAALATQSSSGLGGFFSKSSSQSAPSAQSESGGAAAAPSPHPASFFSLSQYSSETEIELAGTTYQLFIQPLPVSLRQGKQERRLLLCGLRTVSHSRGQSLAVPYNYMIWCVLIALTIFALGWPLLKLMYMNSKERLQARHILYLIFSILLATASVTLIALNASYKLTCDESSENELRQLADQLNRNIKGELHRALTTLDKFSTDPNLLRFAGGKEWNQPKFLSAHQELFQVDGAFSYPYFRYFFLADENGYQRLKFTVDPKSTPEVNVKEEAYFHPILDRDFSHFSDGVRTYDFRLDPLYSPNTGEFLAILAGPLPDSASKGLPEPKLRMKILAIRLESVYQPVLPSGYGFAIVDLDGKVLFDNISARNLNEDFIKECRENASVMALIAQGSTGSLDVSYLGTQKKMWITPVEGVSDPRLTLIVYKDSAFFTTANMAVVIVFGVLVLVYAILPFLVIVTIHVIRQGEYPLESIWPNRDLLPCYFQIVIANALLAAAFFYQYVSYGLVRALLCIIAIATVAAIYPFLVTHSELLRRIGNLLMLVVMVFVSGLSLVLVFPLAFALYTYYKPSRALDNFLIQRITLKPAYTLVVVSILLILVVVPSCGFFKVSYDYVQTLFLQAEQLDLAQRLTDRQHAIKSYYTHIQAPASFEGTRLLETFDRYDTLFLNCPSSKAASSPGAELHSDFVERAILDLTAQFPVNAAVARLQELARTKKDLPGLTWRYSPRVDTCEVSIPATRSLWLVKENIAVRPASAFQSMTGTAPPPGTGPIISPAPVWPALDWRVRFCMTLAVIALAVWIQFVPSRLFLLDMESLPALPLWRTTDDETLRFQPHHILFLGHPKSGKRLTVRKIEDVQHLDFAELAARSKWTVPRFTQATVAFHHFEFGLDDADTNMHKLHLLEEMVYVRHKHIILLSTVDPMYYLNAGSPDIVVPGKDKDLNTAIQLLDRWAAILTPFRKITIEDITIPGFHHVVGQMRRRRTDDPLFQEFVERVLKECDHTAQLRKLGAIILRFHRNDPALSQAALNQELLDRADSYYRILWATCTQDERLVLYQLAKDGWANPKNELSIQHLERRKLVKRTPGLRIMNESFRQFIRNSQYHEEIVTWEQQGEQSVWRSLKMSLGILAVAAAAWLLYSQQQFFNTVVAYVGAIGAAGGVVFKLLSELRGGKSAAAGNSGGG